MLTFTERSAGILRVVLDLAFSPSAALRISARRGDTGKGATEATVLTLETAPEFRGDDELVMAPGGIPVCIAPEVAPVVQGGVIDGLLSPDGRPRLVVFRGGHRTGPVTEHA